MKLGRARRNLPELLLVGATLLVLANSLPVAGASEPTLLHAFRAPSYATNSSAVANFTTAINRLVELVGAAGSGLLALVWARVALSWFSNDIAKKVQAKDRAKDALIGTLLFVAAITGLVWGLAHWVFTGT